VRVTVTTNDYFGAAPYFTVRYGGRANGSGSVSRFTPFADRAAELSAHFLVDVTEPAALRLRLRMTGAASPIV
jgi:hypothetical protein